MSVGPQFFVGVGVAKAGTSWFGRYFAAHPQVWFSPVKELHVFDQLLVPEHCGGFNANFDKRIRRLEARKVAHIPRTAGQLDGSLARRQMVQAETLAETVELYRGFFDERRADAKAFGEITPSYSLLPQPGYQAFLDAYPDAKFLLVLRDPVDRFWSHLRFQGGREDGFDPNAAFTAKLADSGAALRSEYDDLLRRFSSVVPEDNRMVVFFEDVFVDGDSAPVRDICSALGVDFVEPNLSEVVRQSPAMDLPDAWAAQAAARFAPAYEAVADAFGRIPQRWEQRRAIASSA